MAKLKYWLPTLLWMAAIFLVSSFPTIHASGISWQDFLVKKTAHFIEYFILTWLAFRSLKHTVSFPLTSLLLLTFIFAVLYAASDEYHQTFVTGREGRLRDVVIDALGILTAAYVLYKRRGIQTFSSFLTAPTKP